MTPDELDRALEGTEALAQLEKLGFTRDFVAKNVLSVEGPVTVAQIAMLWMGMPNKHDRKRTRQLLEALTAAGLLECVDETAEVWRRKPT
jgi:hypothetical protein